jgi:phosphonate ABC transporter permease subunit PhnE
MRPVRIPLGNLLVGFTLIPVGYFLGTLFLARLAEIALNLGNAGIAAPAAGLIALLGTVVSSTRIRSSALPPAGSPFRSILMTLLISALAVIVIGLIGGIALVIGRIAADGILGYVTRFIGSIGEIIRLILVPLSGIVGAFALSSIGGALTHTALRQLTGIASHVLGAALGALAGAILLGIVATISLSAAWLGLLIPVTFAALTSPILPELYRRYAQVGLRPGGTQRIILTILSWLGSVIGFVVAFSVMDITRSLVEGVLPPRLVLTSFAGIEIYEYVARAMVIGAVVAAIISGLRGTRANFAIGTVLYTVTRTILNALRSIEPLIMGLVFVIWVGIGPFAGVLALTLHSIASLGKLYSEQIETIDGGPIEALQSTGANRLQTIVYAVVPQIIPSYIAFTMYRWDINVRMSTIIGFVGGGGIGFLLQQQINLLRYRDAGVAVLAIAIVVSILDYASAAIRERYV